MGSGCECSCERGCERGCGRGGDTGISLGERGIEDDEDEDTR